MHLDEAKNLIKYSHCLRESSLRYATHESLIIIQDFLHMKCQTSCYRMYCDRIHSKGSSDYTYSMISKVSANPKKTSPNFSNNTLTYIRHTFSNFVKKTDLTADCVAKNPSMCGTFLDEFSTLVFPALFSYFYTVENMELGYNLIVAIASKRKDIALKFCEAFLGTADEFIVGFCNQLRSALSRNVVTTDPIGSIKQSLENSANLLTEHHFRVLHFVEENFGEGFCPFVCQKLLLPLVRVAKTEFLVPEGVESFIEFAALNPKSPHFNVIRTALFSNKTTRWRPHQDDIFPRGKSSTVMTNHMLWLYYTFLEGSPDFCKISILKSNPVNVKAKDNFESILLDVIIQYEQIAPSNEYLFLSDYTKLKPEPNPVFTRLLNNLSTYSTDPVLLSDELTSQLTGYIAEVVKAIDKDPFQEFCAISAVANVRGTINQIEMYTTSTASMGFIQAQKQLCLCHLTILLRSAMSSQNLNVNRQLMSPSEIVQLHQKLFPSIHDKSASDLASTLTSANFTQDGMRIITKMHKTEKIASTTASKFAYNKTMTRRVSKRRNSGDFSVEQVNRSWMADMRKLLEVNSDPEVRICALTSRMNTFCTDTPQLLAFADRFQKLEFPSTDVTPLVVLDNLRYHSPGKIGRASCRERV